MRKFPAIVLYLLIGLPLLFTTLFAISLRSWAFNRSWYEELLTSDRFYELVRDPGFAAAADEKMVMGDFTFHGPSLVAALQKDLPVPELKALTKEAIYKGLDFAEGRTKGLRSRLDLKPLKTAIAAKSLALATDYVKTMPVEPRTPAAGDFSFRPQGLSASLIATRAAEEIRDHATKDLPDSVVWPPENSPASAGLDQSWTFSVARLDGYLVALAAASLAVIAGLALLGASGTVNRLSMAGSLILAPSVIVLALGALASGAGFMIQRGLLPTGLHGLAAGEAGTALAAYFLGATGGITRSLFITGLIGASLSVFLLSFRKWMRPEELE